MTTALVDVVHHQGDVHDATEVVASFQVGMLADAGLAEATDVPWMLERSTPRQLRAHLSDAVPMYLDALVSAGPEEREICAVLVGHLRESRGETVPVLRGVVRAERDATVAATELWALGHLVDDEPDVKFFADVWEGAESPVVRGVCGATLAR